MITKYRNLVVSIAVRAITPFIFLFGFYVTMFGHYSPGGGFQGGTILAAGMILLRLALGKQSTYKIFPPQMGLIIGTIGMLIFTGTGLTALLAGGNFLDYSYLPIPVSEVERRYYGILCVDIGVAFAVFGVLISIFDSLTREK